MPAFDNALALAINPPQPIQQPDLAKMLSVINNANYADAHAQQARAQTGLYSLQQAEHARKVAAIDDFHQTGDIERLTAADPQAGNALSEVRLRSIQAARPFNIGMFGYGIPRGNGGFDVWDASQNQMRSFGPGTRPEDVPPSPPFGGQPAVLPPSESSWQSLFDQTRAPLSSVTQAPRLGGPLGQSWASSLAAPAGLTPPGKGADDATSALAQGGEDVGLPKSGEFTEQSPVMAAVREPNSIDYSKLDNLPDGEREMATAILQGKKPPLNMTRNNWVNQRIMRAVYSAAGEGNFDETTWSRRKRTVDQFATGTPANVIRGMSTLAQHFDTYLKLIHEINPSRYTDLNDIYQGMARRGFTSKEIQDKLKGLEGAILILSTEGPRTFAQTGSGALEDRQQWQKWLSPTAPESAAIEGVKTAHSLIMGQLNSFRDQYNSGTRTSHQSREFLAPEAREVYDRIQGMDGKYNPKPAQPADPKREPDVRFVPPVKNKDQSAAPKTFPRPSGMSDADLIAEAKDSIAKGIPKAAVIGQLRQWGIESPGL